MQPCRTRDLFQKLFFFLTNYSKHLPGNVDRVNFHFMPRLMFDLSGLTHLASGKDFFFDTQYFFETELCF